MQIELILQAGDLSLGVDLQLCLGSQKNCSHYGLHLKNVCFSFQILF